MGITAQPANPITGPVRRPAGRLLIAVVASLALVLGIVGARMYIANPNLRSWLPGYQHPAGNLPRNPAIEEQWGIRFTSVNLLADGGIVEIRYVVTDSSTGGRIHRTGPQDLPIIVVEGSGQEIRSYSLMFHMHHGSNHDEGRAYSIVYGNANNAVKPTSFVTLRMADGLELKHCPVSN